MISPFSVRFYVTIKVKNKIKEIIVIISWYQKEAVRFEAVRFGFRFDGDRN